jgi:hypothetical protein
MVRSRLMVFMILGMAQIGHAEEFIAKARVFVGANSANPTELNDEMALQNIKEFKTITKFGTDITYALNSYLDVGFRYERISQKNLEVTPTAGQDYQANLNQDAVMGIARAGFLKTDVFRGDVFLGAGAASTKFTILNATQDGQLASCSYNSLVAQLGMTLGVGYKKAFLFVEGGYSLNKVASGLEREKTISSNVTTIDLSGSYVVVGILFDGITGYK